MLTSYALLVASLVLSFFAVTLAAKTRSGKVASLLWSTLFLVLLLLSGVFLLSDYLTGGQGLNEAFFFHLTADLDGAAFGDFKQAIFYSIIFVATSVTLAVGSICIINRKKTRPNTKVTLVFACTFMAVAFGVNPGFTETVRFIFNQNFQFSDTRYPEDYRTIDEIDALPLGSKNLVYIYLESLERTYLDQTLFPGLTPNLTRLEAEGLSLTDLRQVPATGWTIAGMVASQCGHPIVTPGGGNLMTGLRFLPESMCLGDVLARHQYDLHYVGGARLKFAGKGNFYRDHGFNSVEGYDELKHHLTENPGYKTGWGLYDDTLFTIVRSRFDQLSHQKQPFGLFTLTVDTHHPRGHLSHSCGETVYDDGLNPILNAVHCSDKMVGELIEYLRAHKAYENTIIVVASDHLAMGNTASHLLKTRDRRNFFVILGRDIASAKIASPASLIDLNALIFNSLGAKNITLGFARNIQDEEASIAVTRNLASEHSNFLLGLWSFPSLEHGVRAISGTRHLQLGAKKIDYPVLVKINADLSSAGMIFDRRLYRQIQDYKFDQPFLWVDSCKHMRVLLDQPPTSWVDQQKTLPMPGICSPFVTNQDDVWIAYVDKYKDLVEAFNQYQRLAIDAKEKNVLSKAAWGKQHYLRHGQFGNRKIDTRFYLAIGTPGAKQLLITPVHSDTYVSSEYIKDILQDIASAPEILAGRLRWAELLTTFP